MAKESEIRDILAAVEQIDRVGDQQWKSSLSPRKIAELEFHDRDRDPEAQAEANADSDTFEKFYGNKKYYTVTQRSNDYVQSWISRESSDRVFLDYACGNGDQTLFAAQEGAALSLGFDISPISVSNARKAAAETGTLNARFFQADAENTLLPDNSIDRILCSGMLHHLDLSYTFPEMRRILKPGGKVLAVEALDINPAIKLYRRLTPDMRTEWEKAHILSHKDLRFASRFFDVSAVNYWHVVGYVGGKFPKMQRTLERLDRRLERAPLLQRMAWIFTFELTKPIEQ